MILVLLLPFALAVSLGLVHKSEVALEARLTALVAEYRETKSLALSTLNEVNEARQQGNNPDPQDLTRVLRQVAELADAIWSHYSERRQSSAQQGANAADVPVIFILLAATRALEEEVQAELSSELGEHSQSTTALRAAHSDILRLADEELQKTSEVIDRS
jgi:hypothetical protein